MIAAANIVRSGVLLIPLGLMACASEDAMVEQRVVPFSASTYLIPSGEWELRIDGIDGANWSCKGRLDGMSQDSFDLPVQTVHLTCVNGPVSGVARYAPLGDVRFTDFSFTLDNGFVGEIILK